MAGSLTHAPPSPTPLRIVATWRYFPPRWRQRPWHHGRFAFCGSPGYIQDSFLAQRVNVLMRMVSMPVTAPSTLFPFLSTSGGQPWQPQRPLRRTLPCKLTVWTISAASATCTLKKATASLRAPSRHWTVLPPNRNIAILIFGFQAMRRNIWSAATMMPWTPGKKCWLALVSAICGPIFIPIPKGNMPGSRM